MTGSPKPTVFLSLTIKQLAASEDFRDFPVSLQFVIPTSQMAAVFSGHKLATTL